MVESFSVEIADIADQIDFGIITMREDEFAAVLMYFKPKWRAVGERHYNIAEIVSGTGKVYSAAIIRTPGQGNSEAQHAASQLINELDPTCLVLVGIAGGKPESEFTLGDVVVATRLHDFSVQAALPDGSTDVSNTGGPMHALIQNAVANLEADKALLGEWNSVSVIGKEHPPVELADANFTGTDEAWKRKVRNALSLRFGNPERDRPPLATAAPIAGANVLMKDPDLLKRWLEHARDLKAVEMELAGVYVAARSVKGDRPILAIRGISDVVGFNRDPEWTEYACRTAASFAYAYISSDVLPIRPKRKIIPAAMNPLRIAECIIESAEDDVPVAMLHVKLQNCGAKNARLKALRVNVARIWDIPIQMSSRLVPWKEPDFPRINVPAKAGERAELSLGGSVSPGVVTNLTWNLFSREAKNDSSKYDPILYASMHPYGLFLFHLQATIVTDLCELELPPLVVHLHGFGMIGIIEQLRVTFKQYGSTIDEAAEALAVIESGAVAEPTLAPKLKDQIDHYREVMAARRNR